MAQNARVKKGQVHSSRSSSRSLKLHTALCRLVINMYAKFDADAMDSFGVMEEQLPQWKDRRRKNKMGRKIT